MVFKVGKIKDYFLSSYTGRGYHTFIQDKLEVYSEIYILTGGSQRVRSRVLRFIAMNLIDRGYDVNRLHSPNNLNYLEGLLIPELKMLFWIEDSLEKSSLYSSRIKKKILNFTNIYQEEKLQEHLGEINHLIERINIHRELVFENLRKLEELNEKLEDVYQENLDFQRVNDLEEKILTEIITKLHDER